MIAYVSVETTGKAQDILKSQLTISVISAFYKASF